MVDQYCVLLTWKGGGRRMIDELQRDAATILDAFNMLLCVDHMFGL